MATVTKSVTLEIIGEHLREAREDIHGLKVHVMEMEDRLRTEFGERFDGIDANLAKIMDHLGIQ